MQYALNMQYAGSQQYYVLLNNQEIRMFYEFYFKEKQKRYSPQINEISRMQLEP